MCRPQKDPVWRKGAPRGTSDQESAPAPHPIPCTCGIPPAFESVGCSQGTNPMDLKAKRQRGGGGPRAGRALPPPAAKAEALGGTGHCPETPASSWAQAAGGRRGGQCRRGTGTGERVRDLRAGWGPVCAGRCGHPPPPGRGTGTRLCPAVLGKGGQQPSLGAAWGPGWPQLLQPLLSQCHGPTPWGAAARGQA